VDFSQGVSSINAYAQSSKPGVSLNVYIDDADAPIGTVAVDPSITNATAINVSSAITGVHKVRFEAKGGSVTLDGWQAVASGEEPPVVEPPVGDTVNPYSAVEAESAASTDMSNARVTPKKDAVSLTQANSYVAYKNVNFAQGVAEFNANVSASTAGMLEIRLDSATGDKVAAFRLDQNGTITTKTTKALATVTGTHDVYFVVAAGSGITLDSWVAKAAEGEEPPVVEPPVEGAINPYAKVEAEIATAEQLTNAMIVPSKDKVVINENGYVLVQNIDFSKGVSAFNVYAQSSKPMVSLNVYIDDAQTPIGTATIGTDITKPTTITVSTDITGVHYVYFEAKGGSVTLDGWQAAPAGEQPPVDPPVGDTVNPYSAVEAESAASTDMSGARVTPKKDAVSLSQANSYVAYKNVNFAQGVAEFNSNVSAASAAMLEVRLDSATGDKVAAFRLSQNSTIETKTTKALATVTGTHDVYFVVTAGTGVTLDSWVAKTSGDQPPVDPPVGDTINPYAKVEAEIATSEQLTNAMITPSKDKVIINENGYVLVQNIDFSQGVSAFNVYVQASKPKVSMNVYIDDSQTPAGTVSVGTDITKPVTINVSSDITGVHYVYFEAKGGQVTFDGWQAAKAGEQPPVNPPATNVDPYSSVDATTASELSGALVTPSKTAVNITPNGSAGTQKVNFTDGVSQFVITASSTSTGKIEVRLNSAAGPLLGTATISGDSKEYTITASKNITGKQTIYFVNSGSGVVNVYSWKATAYSEPIVNPDPPVVQTGMDLTYTINSWTDGYQVSFKVTNNSGSTKNSWKVKVKKSDINLTQSWCVNVSQEGDYYVFTPMSWNSTLTNGQTTEFGIIGSGKVGSTINYIVE
ncbi:MAG: carbohydrate-binding protein, partial [Pseudobutyrivibrio sp.]|nr:carbohydrate-binding protein [Pseudobutyrivibrio sp.]